MKIIKIDLTIQILKSIKPLSFIETDYFDKE